MRKQKKRKSRRAPDSPLLFRIKAVIFLVLLAVTAVGGNFLFQIARKPTELLRYAAPRELDRTPEGMWREYGDIFRAHATRDLTADFLAAMAYVESSGNPLAAPPWRFSFTRGWTRIYAPPSSAVGLFQFTDETFERERHLCVHWGEVAKDGPWYDPRTCWFTGLSTRISPSDSTEITAAYLQVQLDRILAGRRATPVQRRRLAAAIHLCGPGVARDLIDANYDPSRLGSCGGQSPAAYVHRIEVLRDRFARSLNL